MALRNAFSELATETTLDTVKVDQVTLQRELLEKILEQLKIMNLQLSLMTDQELSYDDLDLENK